MLMFAAALIIHFTWFRRVSNRESTNRFQVRTVVGLSLIFWFGIGLAGRMIGFT